MQGKLGEYLRTLHTLWDPQMKVIFFSVNAIAQLTHKNQENDIHIIFIATSVAATEPATSLNLIFISHLTSYFT